MRKFTYASCLAVALFTCIILFNERNPHITSMNPAAETSMKFASLVSGGTSSWEKAEASPMVARHLKVTFTHQEKLSDFVQLSPSNDWQPVTVTNGVAIANYRLNTAKQSYQLAIIRMKKTMPLEAIMNIWQQKAGLPATGHFEVIKTLKSRNDQQLDLYQIYGESKSITLAVHAGEKYTIFRLSGIGLIDDQVLVKFTELLTSASFI